MGLSDSERLAKFFHRLPWWRSALCRLRDSVEREGVYVGDDAPRAIVQKWIGSVDRITGIMVEKLDSSNAFWIFGENESSYRNLLFENSLYGLARPIDDDKEESQSLDWWKSHLTLPELAARLTSNRYMCDEEEAAYVKRLACWWDAWNQVDALLYPINRYRDEVFSAVKPKLIRLLGEMVNLRYPVVMTGGMPNDISLIIKLEDALLARFAVVHKILDKEEHDRWVKAMDNADNKKLRALRKKVREDAFDITPVINRVGDMTLVQVKSFLEKDEEERGKRRGEANAKSENEKASKPNGILGGAPRTSAVLEKILETSMDADEIEVATEELQSAHGISYGIGLHRIEEEGLREKNKKVGTPPSRRPSDKRKSRKV